MSVASVSKKPRKPQSKYESDFDNYRLNQDFGRLKDMLKQSNKSNVTFTNLLEAEILIEDFIVEFGITNVLKAKQELSSVEQLLLSSYNSTLNDPKKASLHTEALMLLCKYKYLIGDHSAVDKYFNNQRIIQLAESTKNARILRLVAEVFTISGMVAEKTPGVNMKTVMSHYSNAAEFCLQYLKACDSRTFNTSNGISSASSPLVTKFLEHVVQRLPALIIKNETVADAVKLLRRWLLSDELKSSSKLKMILVRQLGEILLRMVCDSTYEKIPASICKFRTSVASMRSSKPLSSPPLCFPRYCLFSSTCVVNDSVGRPFLPSNRIEEVYLLLLIEECLASRELVLDRDTDCSPLVLHSINCEIFALDLLSIAFLQSNQFSFLTENYRLNKAYERSMKASFDQACLWHRFALTLTSAGKYDRAIQVLKQCRNLLSQDASICMLISKIALQHTNDYQLAIDEAEEALKLWGAGDDYMKARCYMLSGVGHALTSQSLYDQSMRTKHIQIAIEKLKRAHSIDSKDEKIAFNLALCLSITRQLKSAREYIKNNTCHLESQFLLILLLSAEKKNAEAFNLAASLCEEYLNNTWLLLVKVMLEELVKGVEKAISSIKDLAIVVRSKIDETVDIEDALENVQSNPYPESSVVATSRIEQALSDVASSFDYNDKMNSSSSSSMQAHIWILLSELYLKLGRVQEARACSTEASELFPVSHQVFYLKGLITEHCGDLELAKEMYLNSLAINPSHLLSLHHIGAILEKQKDYEMAEKVLREALHYNPYFYQSWQLLGNVLQNKGDVNDASRVYLTAIELESTTPVQSFSTIDWCL